MATIPASAIVQVTPSVLKAGGRELDIIGLLLTDSDRVPIGTVQQFANAIDVADYFGTSSTEAALAAIYFQGFDNSNIKPNQIKFTQYPTAAVPAYLRGGNVGSLTLTQLQAIPIGTLTIKINGVNIVAATIDLSVATSFSNAASIIQAAFTQTQASATANTISGTTLTLGGTITGTWAPGQTVVGTGVTAGSFIKRLISGTPNTAGATYELSASSTVGVGENMTGGVVPLVTYDSVQGAFEFATVCAGGDAAQAGFAQTIDFPASSPLATALFLDQATGAVISQGADAATPGPFMDALVQISQDWALFMTTFDPDVSGNVNKKAFADWNNTQNNRWCYVCWDIDTAPATQNPATTSLGYLLQQEQASGTILIGGDGTNAVTASYAAYFCGWAASLDFTETNGRATLAFRSQSGLIATCSNQSKADNLIANGYNFYGAYATANDEFIFSYPGSVSGDFLWADSYINQIWMNNQFQLALMELLTQVKSIPYNDDGYGLIEAALLDPITRAVTFGAIRAGVPLSAAQNAEVRNASGLNIGPTLQTQGWYLQILDADPEVRQNRGSPPCTFWYMDGQSIQHINLASIELT